MNRRQVRRVEKEVEGQSVQDSVEKYMKEDRQRRDKERENRDRRQRRRGGDKDDSNK